MIQIVKDRIELKNIVQDEKNDERGMNYNIVKVNSSGITTTNDQELIEMNLKDQVKNG